MTDRPSWILIIEGEEGSCDPLKAMLTSAGYRVMTSVEVGRSHRVLQNQKFGCVLIDHNIRGTSGVSVLAPIKKNSYHLNHSTPFILMGEQLDSGILRQIAKNIEAAFVKPICEQALIEKVNSLVRAKLSV